MASFNAKSRVMLSALALAGLAACESGVAPTVAGNRCDLSRHQQLVGKNIGEVILPPNLRVREISPGEIVTYDYQPGRLNIFLDPKGWIGKVTCG